MAFSDDELTLDDFLGGKLKILQPRNGYRAATDPVLLAAACPAADGQSVLDLGCGGGIAGLSVSARARVVLEGLEIQADYAELARRNALLNAAEMDVHEGDVADVPETLRGRSFDHVIMNPPFYGPGKKAKDLGRATGRQQNVNLDTWLDTGLRRLKPKGWITIISTINWLPDVISALKNRAGSVEIKPLAARQNSLPSRFILRARKGSLSDAVLYNPLVLHKGDRHIQDGDSFTTAAKAILRDGNSLDF